MKRELHVLVLGLFGATLLKLAITGEYTRYVRPEFRAYLIAAGVAVLVVALASVAVGARGLLRCLSAPGADVAAIAAEDGTAHDAGEDHGHRHGRFDVAWLLVVPLLVLLLVAPPPLGTFSAGREGSALGAASTSQLPPLPSGDPVKVSLLGYASRAVLDGGASLSGRTIVLSGFVLPGPAGGWYLTRMVISCCAADAQPIKVGLTGTVPPGLVSNDWIEVTGVYDAKRDADSVNGAAIPYLRVSASQPIPAPKSPYES